MRVIKIPTDAIEQIKIIRREIKRIVPTVSVKNSRGTAWGWVGIRGSGEHGEFTDTERTNLKMLGLTPGGNYANISPDQRAAWVRRLLGHVWEAEAMEPLIRRVVDRIHVGRSNLQVIRELRSFWNKKDRRNLDLCQLRKESYKIALEIHAHNLRTYQAVMTGRF